MNAKKAKALRKQIFGQGSKRPQRTYVDIGNAKRRGYTGTLINDPRSLRGKYRSAKKIL